MFSLINTENTKLLEFIRNHGKDLATIQMELKKAISLNNPTNLQGVLIKKMRAWGAEKRRLFKKTTTYKELESCKRWVMEGNRDIEKLFNDGGQGGGGSSTKRRQRKKRSRGKRRRKGGKRSRRKYER